MKIHLITDGIEFFKKLPARERSMVVAIALIVVAVAFDRGVLQWASRRSRQLDEEIGNTEAGIRRDVRLLGLKNSIRSQQPNLVSPPVSATEDEEMTFLFKEIEKIAADTGVYLVDMKPGGAEGISPGTKYLVNLNLEGTMENLTQFIYKIETHEALLTVEKYDISPKSREHATVKASLTVSILVVT